MGFSNLGRLLPSFKEVDDSLNMDNFEELLNINHFCDNFLCPDINEDFQKQSELSRPIFYPELLNTDIYGQ